MFGIDRGPGLAEVLSQQCRLGDAVVKTSNPNVYLLPAGRLKVSPHRLLGNGDWKAVLEQLPAGFRYVVIDTPPVLAASEALVLAKSADASLLCVMRNVSRTRPGAQGLRHAVHGRRPSCRHGPQRRPREQLQVPLWRLSCTTRMRKNDATFRYK